jgi:hypothetical protein
MKKFRFILLALLCNSFLSHSIAGSTENLFFSDDFSNPSTWTMQGNGAVYAGDSICHFNNVFCGDYNRVYRSMGNTLTTFNWRTECEFTILNANPFGYGTGEVVMALTAGPLDFMSYNAAQSYNETDQDGIAVVLLSTSSSDNNINHWFFMIEAKKGDVRTYDLDEVIYADASISKYFIRLDRLAPDYVELSIFSDPDHLIPLPGSPVSFVIDPGINRLNTIQHGTITPGFYTRLINGELDNDNVYTDSYDMQGLIAQAAKLGISVYPNPASSTISVKADDGKALKDQYYHIFDLLGTEVASDFYEPSKPIDVSRLVKGAFILVLNGTERTLRTKFEKQ